LPQDAIGNYLKAEIPGNDIKSNNIARVTAAKRRERGQWGEKTM
jgi:hypothetical protein